MPQSQDLFNSLLGYSLKRDYLGDSLNWRNVETFSLEILITDLANLGKDAHGNNYLSTYIKNHIAALVGADKNDITIRSIEVPSSPEGKEDLIQIGRYKVTSEVRTAIDNATLIAQHPELDTAGAADGESGKFYGVKDVLTTYTKEIDSISENYTFNDKEDGSKDFSHTVDVTIRSRPFVANQQNAIPSKNIATDIANVLFANDVNNIYFGHNAFTGALQNYGNSANNKHYFEESYDLKKNKYSFTKKMTILPSVAASYTVNPKYSVEWSKDGRVSVSETLVIQSRSGNFQDIKNALPNLTASSYAGCVAILGNYWSSADGMGQHSVADSLSTDPLTKTISYDEQGLTVTVNTNFSNDPQISKAQITETIDLSKDTRGVVTANYNVSLTSQNQKKSNADNEIWYNGLTPLDVLKAYGDNAMTKVCQISNYSNLNNTQRGVFWNTLSWWWPQGADRVPIFGGTEFGHLNAFRLCSMTPTSSTVSSPNQGKQWSLNRVFSNDAIYAMELDAIIDNDYHNFCPNCFKKIEVKWNDVWPKKIISEHPIINRGSSWATMNVPNTSVVSDAYQTEPGKRTVTINATLARPTYNMLTNPIVPVNALKALSWEARNVLSQIALNANIIDSMQWVYYVSDVNYSYNSDNIITFSAELTFTYKKPPGKLPNPWF